MQRSEMRGRALSELAGLEVALSLGLSRDGHSGSQVQTHLWPWFGRSGEAGS